MRIRTGYSFKTAIGDLNKVYHRQWECGFSRLVICDRDSTFGFSKWNNICHKTDRNPVFGVELAIIERFGDKKPTPIYWSFFAKESLKDLNDLVTMATAGPEKFPCLLFSQISEILKNDTLIAVAGHYLDFEKHHHLAKEKNLFIELSPAIPFGFYDQAKKLGFKFCASQSNVFVDPSDESLYQAAIGRSSSIQTYPQYILDDSEWNIALKFTASQKDRDQALKNREFLLSQCNAKMKKAQILKPKRTKSLLNHCKFGAKKIGIDLSDPVYKKRLARELKLIREKGFEDYFHIIIDIVQWSKQRMILGPARGSSCGSLVCYLTDITTIDPIKFNLIFERFIDINRDDLPDIDIDLSQDRRHLAFEYIESKYGSDYCARLGTVSMFQPKSALKECAKSLGIPPWEADKVLENLVVHHSGDSGSDSQLSETLSQTENGQEFLEKYPFMKMACDLENQPSHSSQHAAGVVLTNTHINEIVAIDSRNQSVMCDKKDAESLDLLKIDMLGLKQITAFENCLERIGVESKNGFLEKLPLDDPDSFQILNDHKFSGIFQFVGMAVQGLAKGIKFTDIEDIIAITALARPGPLNAGAAHSWVRRKNKIEKPEPLHSALEEFTKNTLGVITYQEQVMFIVKEIGGLSWGETSIVRKAMGKTMGSEFLNQYQKKFVTGAIKKGISESKAIDIWSKILTFGAYAFNRSHAVAYGMMSYYCCYLKAHYPLEFAAAKLDLESDPDKQIQILRELKKEGVCYKDFDLEKSSDRWEIDKENNLLIGPISNINGIGLSTQAEILDSRKSGIPLRATLAKRLSTAETKIKTLTPIKTAIDDLIPDLKAVNIKTTPQEIDNVQCGFAGDAVIIGVIKAFKKKDENSPEMIQKRNGKKIIGPDQALNMFFSDDTGEIFCKIDRYDFDRIGSEILNTAKAGKSVFVVKGSVPQNFRMISVKQIKYLCEIG